MQQTLGSQAIQQLLGTTTPTTFGLQCISGTVQLFRFFATPTPGTVIGQITPTFGSPIPLIQTLPTPFGGTPLSAVDGQFATVCGRFVRRAGQTVFDVSFVRTAVPPTPSPINQNLLLLLLFLALLGRLGIGGQGLGGLGLGGLGLGGLGLGGLGLGGLGGLGTGLGTGFGTQGTSFFG